MLEYEKDEKKILEKISLNKITIIRNMAKVI